MRGGLPESSGVFLAEGVRRIEQKALAQPRRPAFSRGVESLSRFFPEARFQVHFLGGATNETYRTNGTYDDIMRVTSARDR